MPMGFHLVHTSSAQARARGRRRRAALAAGVIGMVSLSGCMSASNALELPFTEDKSEPTGIAMPKFSSPDLPSTPVPTTENKAKDKGPCDLDDVTLAACLPLTTALASTGPGEALVATDDGALTVVAPGKTPREVARLGAPAKQLLPSPSVEEDRQVFVLRNDDTIARVTLVEGSTADVRELPDLSEPGILGIYFDRNSGALSPRKLLVGDPGIEFQQFCHGPDGMPPLATAILDGTPQLVQLTGPVINPLGGVDLNDSIGGCAVMGDRVVIAIPDAQKVISMPVGPQYSGPDAAWEVKGSPEVLVDGDFGHISHVAAVAANQGIEVWGATTNKTAGAQASESDERVVRLPSDGAAGGSPD
ncbi:glucose dehydrogenase [Corynebacterium amycolatum]|nr:glucose dehydrogenase [Corynebacterium amycolatum]